MVVLHSSTLDCLDKVLKACSKISSTESTSQAQTPVLDFEVSDLETMYKKSLFVTGSITPKRLTSCGTHLCLIAREQHRNVAAVASRW